MSFLTMRYRWAIVTMLAATLLASPVLAQSRARKTSGGMAIRPNQVIGNEITAAQKQAVARGFAWLAATQGSDGAFGGTQSYGAQTGVTSLAALAFMADGNLPGRGKYGKNVDLALKYILRSSQESGLLAEAQSQGVMYCHGFATLFLAEVYGMTGDENVKEKLQKAVRLIQKTQNGEGGWRYMPVAYDADISVTICQVMALRAARDAGIKVEKEVIDKAIQYVRNCQNPDGGFSYQSNRGGMGGGSGPERSAAGVASLYYAGVFEGNNLKRGLDYLIQFAPRSRVHQGWGHYYYGQYYAAQAMFLAGGDYWAQWYPATRDVLIDRQDKTSGSWSGEMGPDYCTAVALIVLQMPNRYLPVFNGKGPGS